MCDRWEMTVRWSHSKEMKSFRAKARWIEPNTAYRGGRLNLSETAGAGAGRLNPVGRACIDGRMR